MTMNWTTLNDFWHMGGYGLYVWGSYAAALLLMTAEALLVRRRWHAARRNAASEQRS